MIRDRNAGAEKPVDDKIIDPVCGMTVSVGAGKPSAIDEGKAVHFCSEGCRAKFVAHPEAYRHGAAGSCAGRWSRSA